MNSIPPSYVFTVCTPTYNRAHTLPRVFESLSEQTFRNFEWLVVDDGSTDATKRTVKRWLNEAEFPIRYVFQPNQGKHVAVNTGVRLARGALFLILDSDDACVPQALERLHWHWNAIPEGNRGEFAGVNCLVAGPDGKIEGDPFPETPFDSDPIELHCLGIRGEKWGFQLTSVMRRYPYPEIPGERYLAPSLVWNRIGATFRTRFINEVLRIRYPNPGSLTASSRALRVGNPKGAFIVYSELAGYVSRRSCSQRHLMRSSINAVRFGLHGRVTLRQQLLSLPSRTAWFAAVGPAVLAFLNDRLHLWWAAKGRRLRP